MTNRDINIFTDCQAAIIAAFHSHMPTNNINVHWVPAHKDILGNELADQQAKAAPQEVARSKDPVESEKNKSEAITERSYNGGQKESRGKVEAEIHAVREDE